MLNKWTLVLGVQKTVQLPPVIEKLIVADAHNLGILQYKFMVISIFLQWINAKVIYKKCVVFFYSQSKWKCDTSNLGHGYFLFHCSKFNIIIIIMIIIITEKVQDTQIQRSQSHRQWIHVYCYITKIGAYHLPVSWNDNTYLLLIKCSQ